MNHKLQNLDVVWSDVTVSTFIGMMAETKEAHKNCCVLGLESPRKGNLCTVWIRAENIAIMYELEENWGKEEDVMREGPKGPFRVSHNTHVSFFPILQGI